MREREGEDQIGEDETMPPWRHVTCHVCVGWSRDAFGTLDEILNTF